MFCAVYEDFVGFGNCVEQCVDNVRAAVRQGLGAADEDITPETCQFFACESVGIRRARWEFAFADEV